MNVTKGKTQERFLFLLLGIWIVLNLLSAGFTELEPDESYYWRYAQDLAWGYFDHPPLVALFIKMGYFFFKNEIGVRICTILFQAVSFYCVFLLAGKPKQKKEIILLALLVSAMPLLHFFGFITTPDSPLLVFTPIFFLAYRNFLEQSSWKNTFFLGLVMTVLLYAKYHGVLLIGFTLLSNLKLLKQSRWYMAVLVGALLYIPHLAWQVQNDFPTWQYHLVGRTSTTYAWKNTLEFLLNQCLIFSPFLFPVFLMTLIKHKQKDLLSRAYTFTISGFLIFFLLNTFRGYAQPHWTALITIPWLLLTYLYVKQKEKLIRTTMVLSSISLGLMLIIRILVAIPPVKEKTNFNNRDWVMDIEKITGNTPVLFHNSYRDASLFAFYSRQSSTQFTDIDYRKNQYDLWNDEVAWFGKDIFFATKQQINCPPCATYTTKDGFNLYKINKAQIFEKVEVRIIDPPSSLPLDSTYRYQVSINNPYPFEIDLESIPTIEFKVALWHVVRRSTKHYLPVSIEPGLKKLAPRSKTKISMTFTTPDSLPHQDYLLSSGFGYSGLGPIIHEKILVKIRS